MSLWVLIRKDEERMSYAENYFFFNSMSKRKIRLGEIICKAEKSKSRNLFCLLFRENATKVWFLMNVGVIIYLVVWGGCENNHLSWLGTLLVSLAGFFILFQPKRSDNYYFLNTNLVSQGVRFDFSSSRRIFQPWELIWSITAGRFFLLKTLFSLAGSFLRKSFCSIVLILGMRVHQASFESSYSV